MKHLSILGSTGSIGTNTLAIVSRYPERFSIDALCAGRNVGLLAEQIKMFQPELAVVLDDASAEALQGQIPPDMNVTIMSGPEGYRAAAILGKVDMVVSAIVGAAGLDPTVAAIEAGKTIALANKEVLVMAGAVVMKMAADKNVAILPVDSEHSAIFQCLEGHGKSHLSRIHLTASGGPFLNKTKNEIKTALPADALAHPTWTMGRKISIDSATLMNKGLEVIEACRLFDVGPDEIEVVIHPQSIVHSMVSYIDGAVLAQLGTPDMKGAIAYALSYPERIPSGQATLDLTAIGQLTFVAPDVDRFPCLGLAFEACRRGGTCPAVLNAANEVAVTAFLDEAIPFLSIPATIEAVLERHTTVASPTLADIKAADAWARESARQWLAG